MEIKDHLNNPMKALDVFSLSIRYLKDECIELFQKKRMTIPYDEILWILTVPAIWDESAKQFMRKAAEQVAPYVPLNLHEIMFFHCYFFNH